jgi:sialate O-acetylesterase
VVPGRGEREQVTVEYEQSFRCGSSGCERSGAARICTSSPSCCPGYDHKDWPYFREVQLQSLDLSHTGVVNTIDLGDAKNIHPPDKEPIAKRLALLARSDVYGQRVGSRGPMLDSFTPRGNRMRVAFDHAEGLKTTDGKPPAGFWLAGSDRKWHPATATIDGNTVVLTAEGVDAPVACRYAFSGKPKVNLINKDNLPAYPFRTDDWTR